MKRMVMIWVISLGLWGSITRCEGTQSEWVHPGPDGKLVYKTTPAGDRIMDFSYAGYMGGGVALPQVPARITVQPVEGDNTAVIQEAIDKVSALNVGAKDFSPLRGAVLLAPGNYTCSGTISIRTSGVVLRGSGDNIWHVATGGRQAGPIVLLNCAFQGSGHIEGHQRWTTGMLLDNCQVPAGGVDFKNRGAMGSGHGWGVGWAVAWNCVARTYVVQQPPGAANWMIGCQGENVPTPRPFDKEPTLPPGICDAPGTPVAPRSLYLAQLADRLGPQAVRNIGYSSTDFP